MPDWTVETVADMTQDEYTKMSEAEYDALPEPVRQAIDERVKSGSLVEKMSPVDAQKALLQWLEDNDVEADDTASALAEFEAANAEAAHVLLGVKEYPRVEGTLEDD